MIRTRLTERFGLTHPVVSAPMAFAAGGRLGVALNAAGGLGLIGGIVGGMVAEAERLVGGGWRRG
jgi:nitronate monooxygenase